MMQLSSKMQRAAARTSSTSVNRYPAAIAQTSTRRSLQVVRVQEQNKTKEANSDSNLNQEQLNEIGRTKVGDISPQKAEMRADMGTSVTDPMQMQAFDGPAPETTNGRTAMLGVMIALAYELRTGMGLKEQIADHPFAVIAVFVIIAFATHVPLSQGVTRKEPYETGIWTAKAENQNGRLAMMGFLGMVITEAIAGVNTLQLWGLQ